MKKVNKKGNINKLKKKSINILFLCVEWEEKIKVDRKKVKKQKGNEKKKESIIYIKIYKMLKKCLMKIKFFWDVEKDNQM